MGKKTEDQPRRQHIGASATHLAKPDNYWFLLEVVLALRRHLDGVYSQDLLDVRGVHRDLRNT